jgi:hypothetical protein
VKLACTLRSALVCAMLGTFCVDSAFAQAVPTVGDSENVTAAITAKARVLSSEQRQVVTKFLYVSGFYDGLRLGAAAKLKDLQKSVNAKRATDSSGLSKSERDRLEAEYQLAFRVVDEASAEVMADPVVRSKIDDVLGLTLFEDFSLVDLRNFTAFYESDVGKKILQSAISPTEQGKPTDEELNSLKVFVESPSGKKLSLLAAKFQANNQEVVKIVLPRIFSIIEQRVSHQQKLTK